MAEMPEEGPIRLAHREPSPFALAVIGLRQRDGDQTIVMTGHHLFPGCHIVGKEIEDQPVTGVLGSRLDWQVPPKQRIKQPVFGDLQFAPSVQVSRVAEVRHGTVMPAGPAIGLGRPGIDKPVAGVKAGIGAQHTLAVGLRQCPEAGPLWFQSGNRPLFGDEGELMAAPSARAVFKIKQVCTRLTEEEFHAIFPSDGQFRLRLATTPQREIRSSAGTI